MSGPTGPFDGERGPIEELPWRDRMPGPEPESTAGAAVGDDAAAGDEPRAGATPRGPFGPGAPPPPDPGGVGGGLLVARPGLRALVRAGVPCARARPGPQVVVTVHQGESTDSVVDALEPAPRDRELVGLPDLGGLPRHADRAAGELRAAPEPVVLRGARDPGRGPEHLPGRCPPRASRSPRWPQEVDSLPGHTGGGFEKTAASGAVHSIVLAAGFRQPRGDARHRELPHPPR